MKEKLFRGQTRRKGEYLVNYAGKKCESNWVYGGVCFGKGDFSIIYGYMDDNKDVIEESPNKRYRKVWFCVVLRV